MIIVKLIDSIPNPETRFYEIKLSNGSSKFVRISQEDCITYRGTLEDIVCKIAEEYAEDNGLSALRMVFV